MASVLSSEKKECLLFDHLSKVFIPATGMLTGTGLVVTTPRRAGKTNAAYRMARLYATITKVRLIVSSPRQWAVATAELTGVANIAIVTPTDVIHGSPPGGIDILDDADCMSLEALELVKANHAPEVLAFATPPSNYIGRSDITKFATGWQTLYWVPPPEAVAEFRRKQAEEDETKYGYTKTNTQNLGMVAWNAGDLIMTTTAADIDPNEHRLVRCDGVDDIAKAVARALEFTEPGCVGLVEYIIPVSAEVQEKWLGAARATKRLEEEARGERPVMVHGQPQWKSEEHKNRVRALMDEHGDVPDEDLPDLEEAPPPPKRPPPTNPEADTEEKKTGGAQVIMVIELPVLVASSSIPGCSRSSRNWRNRSNLCLL